MFDKLNRAYIVLLKLYCTTKIQFLFFQQMVQDLDARMTKMKIQVMERTAHAQDHRYKRMQRRLQGSLERNVAYKMVVDKHNISNTDDYHSALNGNYTYDALKPEVQKMMERLKPSYIREQKAKMQLKRSKDAQKMIIERNLEHPSLQTARDKERRERERQKREAGAGGAYDQTDQSHFKREHSDIVFPSAGSFLLSRWANTFTLSKTPTVEVVNPSPDKPSDAVGLSESQSGKLKAVSLAKPNIRRGGLLVSPRPSRRRLQPLSVDGRSQRSEASSYKTMSVDRVYHKRVRMDDSSADDDVAPFLSPEQQKKKRKKRYTLPPVNIKKGTVKIQIN